MTISRRIRTRTAALIGAAALAGTALIGLSAAPAAAVPRANHCGSAYGFLKSWPIEWRTLPGGYIDVYYNSSNGYNCVVVRTNDSVIHSAWDIMAGARPSGGAWVRDGDKPGQHFTKYAGPVYVHAPGSCIDIYGAFDASGGGSGQGYERVHCG